MRLQIRTFFTMACLLATGTVYANSNPGTARSGKVDEVSQVPTDFVVHLSGDQGQEVFPPGWPRTLVGQRHHVPGTPPSADTWVAHTGVQADPNVYDAFNTTTPKVAAGGPGNPGGGSVTVTAVLSLESLYLDSNNHYQNAYIFDTLYHRVGYQEVFIPDLYISDSSGALVNGGVLYSLVDLDVYLNSIPTFTLGETFAITNGVVSGLPGMEFSSTPFVFDSAGGTGYIGTPYTGYGYTLTEHGLAATPEPSSLSLLTISTLGLLSFCWRRIRGQNVDVSSDRG